MNKQPALTTQTKANIVNAFWELYCTRPMREISVKAITEKAGYHRSTFYEYFTDPGHVLRTLEESLLEYVRHHALEDLQRGFQADVIKKVAIAFDAQGQYLEKLLGDSGDPTFSRKMKDIMIDGMTRLLGLPSNDTHISYCLEFAMSAIIGTLVHWYGQKRNLGTDELVLTVRSLLAHGVMPELQKAAKSSFTMLPEGSA